MAAKKKAILTHSLKLVGETMVLPGSSLLIDGKVKKGALHAGVGLLAGALLGGPAILLVAANSFSLSLTGKSLPSNLNLFESKDQRAINLKERVKKDSAAGLTLEEIREDILEDVEDLYLEAKAANQSNDKESQ